jgi:AcrR family transcriptional regulator
MTICIDRYGSGIVEKIPECQTLQKGRPREFDADEVLDRALDVFWRKGYEGASLSELTEAMGINRPSLYAAFGNKEELFRKALDRYADGPAVCEEQPTH